jgi:hypothetical protein
MRKYLIIILLAAGCAVPTSSSESPEESSATNELATQVMSVLPEPATTLEPRAACQMCFSISDCIVSLCGHNCLLRPGGNNTCTALLPP